MSDKNNDSESELVRGAVVMPLGDGVPPGLQQMEAKIRLPHGYTVVIRFDEHGAPSFSWTPKYPTFRNQSEERRFWRRYYDARNRAMQDIATETRGVIVLTGTDGMHVFEPATPAGDGGVA
jgi:hypothetical protein